MRPAPLDPPEVTHRLWEGFAGHTGWDVGANCGQTLHHMASCFDQVIAFEPAVECLDLLWKTCLDAARTFDKTVVVKPIAVSDHDGEVTLAALPDKIDTGQLVTPGTHGMEWTPDIPEVVARTVPCRSLDSLADELASPDFVKVDVEGHEGKVLDGARRLLDLVRPDWLIEFHTPELHNQCQLLLERYGYDVTTIRHPHYRVGGQMYFQHGWLRAHVSA